MTAQLICPFLIMSLGLAPKKAGSHKTRSAIFPTSTEPRTFEIPCAIAGFIVIFAT